MTTTTTDWIKSAESQGLAPNVRETLVNLKFLVR